MNYLKGTGQLNLNYLVKNNPEGVWVNLPDYEISSGEPNELELALESLGIEELIIDGNNLGYLLDEPYDDKDFFLEHLKP